MDNFDRLNTILLTSLQVTMEIYYKYSGSVCQKRPPRDKNMGKTIISGGYFTQVSTVSLGKQTKNTYVRDSEFEV